MTVRTTSRISSIRLRRWLPRMLAIACGVTAGTVYGQPPAPMPMAPAAAPAMPALKEEPEKMVPFSFADKPWKGVLDWFATESGLVYYSSGGTPSGSVTIKTVPGKLYTLSQVIDLMNEALSPQNFIIIRRTQTFTVLPADVKIPKDLLPKITIEELAKRGDTEMVEVTYNLKFTSAEEIVPNLQKRKGPFGEVYALGSNQVILQDTAKNVRVIVEDLKALEAITGDSLTYHCKFIRVTAAAELLKNVLTDASTQVTSATAVPPSPYGQYGGSYYPPQDYGRDRGRSSAPPTTTSSRFKSVQISTIENTNTIIITAPADKIATATKFLKEIDVPQQGELARVIGPPEFKYFAVPAGTADTIAKTLTEVYKTSAVVRITALPARNEVQVYAPPADLIDIAKVLRGGETLKPTTVIKVIPIRSFREPKDVVDQLKRLYPDSGTGIQIDPVTDPSPGLIVKGTQQQVDEIEAAYKQIDLSPGVSLPGGPGTRVIPVENGNASLVAEALAESLRKTRGNPVELRGTTPPPAPAPMPNPGTPPKTGMLHSNRGGVQPVNFQLVDPAQPAQPKADPSKKGVTITVIGGKIVITSEDGEALEYATQLARLFLKESNTIVDNRYEILPLKNCSAEEAAKSINELFNITPPAAQAQAPGGGGRGQGGGGGGQGGIGGALGFLTSFAGIGGAQAPAAPAPGRIKVVAEKQSNSLIVVKASELDLAMIKQLLARAIDTTRDATSSEYPKTHFIKLSFARAEEVQSTLNTVFANLTGSRARGAGAAAVPFNPFVPQQPQAAQPSQLTISIDDRSNALIVNCSDPVFAEVTKIVGILDESAKNQNEVVQVIKLEGIDPALVEEAIRALNGTPTTGTQRQGGGTTGGGAGANPFAGFGGFGGGLGQGGGTGGRQGGGRQGGSTGTRGGRNRAPDIYGDGGGGRDFFDDRDMDVPSAASMIYDPEDVSQNTPQILPSSIRQAQYSQTAVPIPQAPPMGVQPPMGTPPAAPPITPGGVITGSTPAPVDPVTAESIPGTPLLLLRAKNQRDMDAILKFIEFIKTDAKAAQIKVQLVPMKYQDASSVVNILNVLFSRVQIGPGSTTLAPATNTQGPRLGGGGGFAALFGGGGQQQSSAAASTVGSIFMLPLPRFNAIMLAVPESRLPDVMKEIERLDVPNASVMSPTRFQLKNSSAQNVSQQVQTFFNGRYGSETQAQNQIRVFFDAQNNCVFVQASPADVKDIAVLIEQLDTDKGPISKNELRVFKLKNAFSDEIAQVLYTAITSNAVNPASSANAGTAAGTGGTGLGGGFGAGGAFGAGQQAGGLGGQQGALGRTGAVGGLGTTGASGTSGVATRSVSVSLFDSKNGKLIAESGILQDVHITPDARINTIIVSAPGQTMRLIEKLIEELDVPSAASSDVKVFTLKKSDATTTATLIQQLFSRSTTTGGLGGGNQGGFGGLLGGQQGGGTQQNQLRPLITLTGDISEGANLIDLRLSVDVRTNSLIVAGSPSDLDTIRAIIAKLEDSESTQLQTKVYKLRNSAAADVQTALLTFLQTKLQNDAQVFSGGVFQTLQRQIFMQAEPVSNTLLIAIAPQYFDEVVGLIEKLDAPPPQVFVQVLIAEVQLRNAEEFGMEFGLQSPVLFARSSTGGGPGNPGFNFNTTTVPVAGQFPGLPNTTLASPNAIGVQGLGNLGVGRSGATGVGGFVFSAASDTFNVLIRALKAQSRIDVLSKPQMLLMDNQVGFFQVGQRFPINGPLVNTNAGVTTSVTYEDIGIVLRVTPRINPDGRVLMRVEPSITNPSPALVNLGNGQTATAFDTETVLTTVLASDGETIVIGGLIRRSDTKTENKIPVLGDIPYIGAAFRYRTQNKERREVIFIVTPTLVRSEADMARVGAVETAKMGWVPKDVMNVNTYGGALIHGQNPYALAPDVNCYVGPPNSGGQWPAPLPGGVLPDGPATAPGTPTPYTQPLPGGIVPDHSKGPALNGVPVSRAIPQPVAPVAPAPLPANVVQPTALIRRPAQIWPQEAPMPVQPAAAPVKPVETKPKEGHAWGVFKR